MFIDEANETQVKEAESICGAKNDACIFDYLVTRDDRFAQNTKEVKKQQEINTKSLGMRYLKQIIQIFGRGFSMYLFYYNLPTFNIVYSFKAVFPLCLYTYLPIILLVNLHTYLPTY